MSTHSAGWAGKRRLIVRYPNNAKKSPAISKREAESQLPAA
ncbi:hypothetical protein GBL_1319 [Geobacillus kaustophilus GBlys]|uniref:Uncharacterized protein n=1 Tax=Geobacillus kaustophilus GBlys TaxID=1337888 RepID=U2X3E4_GEOKU|nr:hypothetical protein GBL_1319 [Geobacillus kaustophilus GBlys]